MRLYNNRTLYRRVYLRWLQVWRVFSYWFIWEYQYKSIAERSYSLLRGRVFTIQISLPRDVPTSQASIACTASRPLPGNPTPPSLSASPVFCAHQSLRQETLLGQSLHCCNSVSPSCLSLIASALQERATGTPAWDGHSLQNRQAVMLSAKSSHEKLSGPLTGLPCESGRA
jgi:hypothetical protein